MLPRLLLLFIIVPLLELAVLIKVGGYIGVPETIAIVLLAGVFGAWLVRREGLRALRAIQAEFAAGRLPADSMIDALLVLVAGVLLITPGLITDAFGFLLIMPPIRRLVARIVRARFRARFAFWHFGDRPIRGDFIDVEGRPADTPPPPLDRG
jgi:UPF0716 protein FxsA